MVNRNAPEPPRLSSSPLISSPLLSSPLLSSPLLSPLSSPLLSSPLLSHSSGGEEFSCLDAVLVYNTHAGTNFIAAPLLWRCYLLLTVLVVLILLGGMCAR